MRSYQERARFTIEKLQKDLAEVGLFEYPNICSLHICNNNIIENASSSAFIILDFKGNMLIDTAIKILIKNTNVLSVVLTHWPVTGRPPTDLSFFFFLPELPSPWILFKFFPQNGVVDVCSLNYDLVPSFSLCRPIIILTTPGATVSCHRSPLRHQSLASRSLIKDFLLFSFQFRKLLLESFIISVLLLHINLCLFFF
jgi:hypothetical protein